MTSVPSLTRAPRRRCRGMSLIELMVSLSVGAALLVAVAASFSATTAAASANDDFFRACQSARLATNQVTAEVRRCTAVLGIGSDYARLRTVDAAGTTWDRTWAYVPATGGTDGQVRLTDNATGTTRVLADHVAAATFTPTVGTDAAGAACVTSVTYTMTVRVGDAVLVVSGSAATRASLTY